MALDEVDRTPAFGIGVAVYFRRQEPGRATMDTVGCAAVGLPRGRDSPVRYAVGLPNLADYADPRALAEESERAGWDTVFPLAHRDATAGPIEVVLEGQMDGLDAAADAERVERCAREGLTWRIEKLNWSSG